MNMGEMQLHKHVAMARYVTTHASLYVHQHNSYVHICNGKLLYVFIDKKL